jgi:hypothetical protein
VNGGLAGASVGGETSASASCERMDREPYQQEETRAGETAWFGARPRVTRDRHPAVVTLPERRCGSRGTGVTKRARGQRACSSRHRILRRVPIDGRHPGSKEASSFTRRRGERSRRLTHPRDPQAHPKGRRRGLHNAKALETEGEEWEATGMSEARSHRAPWEENAHACERGR